MKTILVTYKVVYIGEKEFVVPDDFDIADNDAVYKLLEDCDEVKLVNEAEFDELAYGDVFELWLIDF